MDFQRILKEFISPIVYNLQILPDLLLAGSVMLAILLANPTVVALAVGALATQGLTRLVATLLMAFQPSSAIVRSSLDICTGGFIGRSWSRLFKTGTEHLWHPLAPSVYLATVGFFVGYGGAVAQLYKEEVDAGMLPRGGISACMILGAIIALTALLFRYFSNCDTLLSGFGGLAFGIAIGYFGAVILGYATNRRGTNIWGTPLLRDRINNGAPVYVCPTGTTSSPT
jgi:hypothetical protein